MDKRKCSICGKTFNFAKTGLEGPGGVLVCGNACARKSAASHGNTVAIHDKTGKVVDTNADGTETHHEY